MLINLTFAHNKSEFWIKADHIRSAERSQSNQLLTVVSTMLMTPQGPVAYEVLESPQEVADRVNKALEKK